jgi:peptidoglycan/LPS O-acetylase OafA/YrhL
MVVLGGRDRSFLLTEALTSITYTTDFYLAQGHWQNGNFGTLGHTWSLAVEEQFYLAWPLALLFLLRSRASRGWRVAIVLAAAAAAAGWRAYLSSQGLHTHVGFAFDTHLDVLLVGCALGLVLPVAGARMPLAYQRISTGAAFAALGVIAFVTVVHPYLAVFPLDVGYLVIAVATAAMIVRLAVPPETALARRFVGVFSLAPVVWIGAISYGIYLWHVIVFAVYKRAFDIHTLHERAAFAPLLLLTTLGAATLSYYVVEQPFLRLKDRRFQGSGRVRLARVDESHEFTLPDVESEPHGSTASSQPETG